MPRLTADTIASRDSYLSTLKDREIDLRGMQIPAIENLGVTKDQMDSIDLSENSIQSLSNLPHLHRLRQLLMANNPIHTISPNLANALPNLTSLILSSTELKTLKDIEPITHLKRLEFLSLRDSPVTQVPHYRQWLAFKCKNLRFLDFERVKDVTRLEGKRLFQDSEGKPTTLAESISTSTPSGLDNTFEPGASTGAVNGAKKPTSKGQGGRLLSAEEKTRVRNAIEKATTVDEVRRLQRMLAEGFVPSEKDLASVGGNTE